MNEYNPHMHHRRSIRLKSYDYSQAGSYFITICCQDRICRFGRIVKNEMILNEFGQIAYDEWLKTPEIRPNVELDVFIIMPNHVHGIIIFNNIGRGELNSPDINNELNSPDIEKGVFNTPLRSPSNNIGAIIRGYKSSVTKQIRMINNNLMVWQRNYHEHIIRNEQSYQTISNYIVNNPAKWNDDKLHKP